MISDIGALQPSTVPSQLFRSLASDALVTNDEVSLVTLVMQFCGSEKYPFMTLA
jgi:hypothetical protein